MLARCDKPPDRCNICGRLARFSHPSAKSHALCIAIKEKMDRYGWTYEQAHHWVTMTKRFCKFREKT